MRVVKVFHDDSIEGVEGQVNGYFQEPAHAHYRLDTVSISSTVRPNGVTRYYASACYEAEGALPKG